MQMRVGLLSLLTVLFVGLKLTGYMKGDWSWFYVLLPTIIDVTVGLLIIALAAVVASRK
jgi:hypothetical protein